VPGSPVDFLTVPALVGTRHGFLTRRGGVSSGLFASLNVGLGSSDDRGPVQENRCRAVDAVAPGAPPIDDVWVAMDARMGEIYAAHALFGDGAWQWLTAPMLCTPQVLIERWRERPPVVVAGSALSAFGPALPCGQAQVLPDALPRATAMLPLAAALWDRGGAVDAALALPVYLRDKVAQTMAERAAIKRAAAAGEPALDAAR
jgi:tRNA threonylcarbamoyladenosine biosynthesis protein TsaB